MGRVACTKKLPLLLRRVTSIHLRCFSLSAAPAVVYPQFSHAHGVSSPVNSSDFIYRHSYSDGPFAAFKTGRLSGLYRKDPRQEGVILKLQELHGRLNATTSSLSAVGSRLTVVENVRSSAQETEGTNWFSGIVNRMKGERHLNGAASTQRRKTQGNSTGSIQGLYMHGGVGVGKTMLMDMFVATKPEHVKVKRAHFHSFMLGIHAKLREQAHKQDPLGYVAESLSAKAHVLALDELFVEDVADAMIINRLFKALWENDMVLIATSNRKPDDLYLGGLQRDLFLPFIDRLKERCVVHDMESLVDYRKLAQHNKGMYFMSERRTKCLNEAFAQKTAGHSKKRDTYISLKLGRKMHVPLSSGSHCYYTFDQLCGNPVGSADYLGLCQHFHTIFIQDIPRINAANKSAAYRFVTLIDILYDNRIRLFCSADGDIDEIFASVISHADSLHKPNGKWVVDDKLSFTKERTTSRMTEMESMEYLVDHANRHAPELLLALAEAEAKSKEEDEVLQECAL